MAHASPIQFRDQTAVGGLPGLAADTYALEVSLLLEAVYRRYGFDFRQYSLPSLRRRIWNAARAEGLYTISALQERILHDSSSLERFLWALSVQVTGMFRDPEYYRVFREQVVPSLKTCPWVRLWLAGCSTGEEVYSMAMLLEEEGLYDRCRIYATDLSRIALKLAREGVFPLASMREFTRNYHLAGGTSEFSTYFTARYDRAIFDASLRRNVVFAQHNLAADTFFNKFQVILSRNVLIYFNAALRDRVQALLHESLNMSGILMLGARESLASSAEAECYERVHGDLNLYRKIK